VSRRKLTVGLITAVVVLIAAYVAVRILAQQFEKNLMETKAALESPHETMGVIVGRKQVRFETGQTSYINAEGKTIPLDDRLQKDGEFRVYYKINDFNQMPSSMRSGLARVEQEREKRFGPRFTVVDERAYDKAQLGQGVDVTYHWASDSNIYIIAVGFLSEHSRAQPLFGRNGL
jgi:hypothetical protein